jgi:hypothetical protein
MPPNLRANRLAPVNFRARRRAHSAAGRYSSVPSGGNCRTRQFPPNGGGSGARIVAVGTILFNVAFDSRQPQVLGRFWRAALGLTVRFESDDVVRLAPPEGSGAPNILIMKVDDPTPGKNRVHIDLAADDVLAEVHRLMVLGATLADGCSADAEPLARTSNNIEWFTLRDPDGNEFCIGAHPL